MQLQTHLAYQLLSAHLSHALNRLCVTNTSRPDHAKQSCFGSPEQKNSRNIVVRCLTVNSNTGKRFPFTTVNGIAVSNRNLLTVRYVRL